MLVTCSIRGSGSVTPRPVRIGTSVAPNAWKLSTHAPKLRVVWQFVIEVLRENEAILMGRG